MSILTDLHSRLSSELDKTTAGKVVDIIHQTYGGAAIYIPRRPPFQEMEIRAAASSMSVKDAARACGVTERCIYKALGRLREEKH